MPRASDQLPLGHPDVEVWAAGGIITRVVNDDLEVLLAHRPNHVDWTFPKGKLDEGETLRSCALREVHEETGLHCTTHNRLDPVFYRDDRNRRKGVVYWIMSVDGGAYVPNDEVDAIGWFDLQSADTVLTYKHDRALLRGVDVDRIRSTMRP